MGGRFILESLWICSLFLQCSGQCTFPTNLRGSWISSEIGANELTFADSSLSGYTVHTFGTFNFTCEIESNGYYVLKSEIFTRYTRLNFNAYLCLNLTSVARVETGDLYTYYKNTDQLPDAGNERVKIWLTSRTLISYTEICTVTDNTDLPYSVLIKNGTVDTVKQDCPIPFLGQFGYTYDTGSGALCNTSSSYLDVCTDKTLMTWNYTLCSQIQAYSTGGIAACVHEEVDANNVYTLHVYNMDDTVDQSTTYRFTCYRVTGYGSVNATQYPGNCVSGQNETAIASPGGALQLTSSVLCAYPSPASDSEETLSAGAIAGIVVACFIIIIVIVVLLGCKYYRKRKREQQEAWEAANKKVDPDELSPNMRLGLPDESKYDLDRLMYTPTNETDKKPEKKRKNGFIKGIKGKGSRKDLLLTDRMESYNAGEYMDETQRQTALESSMYAEKRKRKDGKDEFKANDPKNKQFSDRIKEMAKGRRRPFKVAALAKLRFRPKAKPILDEAENPDGRTTQGKDIVIQVEEAEIENKRKTRFADEEPQHDAKGKAPDAKKLKALEDIDTLSDIVDNEMGVNDLSDEEKEPRLKLPNLNPKKKEKKRHLKQDKYSLESGNQPTSAMPLNTRFMPPKAKRQHPEQFEEPMPLIKPDPNYSALPPLQRIHRKESSNAKLWKAHLAGENGKIDLEELKRKLPENKWRQLLEELYRDKKYFDYVKKSSSQNELELGNVADESLQFLYGRALFWEQQQPIPTRPPSHVKRMYSHRESDRAKSSAGLKRSSSLKRSATTLSRSKSSSYKFKTLPRTPSTQVSRLRRRQPMTPGKKTKDNVNNKLKNDSLPNGGAPLVYFEGGTQTDFSPPLSPLLLTDSARDLTPLDHLERMSLPGSVILEEDRQSMADSTFIHPAPGPMRREDTAESTFMHPPPGPLRSELTKSDIQLEEMDENNGDNDYNHETFGNEEVTIAI